MEQLIGKITPDIYQRIKLAVEIGKWEDGNKLTSDRLDSCMQIIILYETKHVAEKDRAGFDLSSECSSKQSSVARLNGKQS
ncbi:MAG: hypothetical protein COA96_00180 [SAR86 cluster bacterium]|uniref:DUF1315 family protein n=1 Tax=SAR86 cluster bacterium TaxID=2030880 RepID=A0A2A5BB57_9GAMM|nr:MAG: hypothetical protein COA96_00180 [SAR86 cluster bacterium]